MGNEAMFTPVLACDQSRVVPSSKKIIEDVMFYVGCIIEGLSHLHERKIAHRAMALIRTASLRM
jgi:hypothetical protein